MPGLLDEPRGVPARAIDVILVPTYRPVNMLQKLFRLARLTQTPLMVVCSKEVHQHEVVDMAARAGVIRELFRYLGAEPAVFRSVDRSGRHR